MTYSKILQSARSSGNFSVEKQIVTEVKELVPEMIKQLGVLSGAMTWLWTGSTEADRPSINEVAARFARLKSQLSGGKHVNEEYVHQGLPESGDLTPMNSPASSPVTSMQFLF